MATATKTPKRAEKKTRTKTNAKRTQGKKKRVIDVYDYPDELGVLLYQAVKYGPKEVLTKDDAKCHFRRPNPESPPDLVKRADANNKDDNRSHWIWDHGERWVLYGLDEIADSANISLNNAGKRPLFICEGEPDADCLRNLGLLATTNPAGAGSWRDEYSLSLSEYRSVVILPDNDQPGRDGAEKKLKSLQQSLAYPGIPEIRVIPLPGLPEKGDVRVWFNANGSKRKLLTLVKDRLPERRDSETDTEFPIDEFRPTDAYNAYCFVKKHFKRINYCREIGWLFYDGKRWNRDIGEITAAKLARQTIQTDIFALIKKALTGDEHDRRYKHFLKSENDNRLKGMLHVARSFDEIVLPFEELDADPYVFNCKNGTLNLRTMEFHKHRPADWITKLAPVIYHPDAKCPRWLDCLNTWMQGDKEIIDYLQRLMGMCLTADICARIFPVFFGSGYNGKSVLLDTCRLLMGDYGWEAPEGLLAEKRDQGHSTEIASLAGRRLVTVSETKANMTLRTSLVKHMTGDQMLTARFMRQDNFSFPITHKTILSTQNRPRIMETSNAIWDRLHLVAFLYRIPKKDRIPRLTEELKSEWPGILNWLLEGCKKWQEAGGSLEAPESVKAATQEYRESSDILADFVETTIRLKMPETSTIRVTELYKLYKVYAKANEIEHPISVRNFNEYFRTKGVRYGVARIGEKTAKVWFGIGLQEELPF